MAVLAGLVSAISRRAPSSRRAPDRRQLEREAVALAAHRLGHARERVVGGLGLRGADAQRADAGELAARRPRHEHRLGAAPGRPEHAGAPAAVGLWNVGRARVERRVQSRVEPPGFLLGAVRLGREETGLRTPDACASCVIHV